MPPVGSVFNVIYFGTDDHFLLYSALPHQSGADVSVIKVKGRVTTSALSLIDATAPPGHHCRPRGCALCSGLRPAGQRSQRAPRPGEVQIQGYQQFDIQDSSGARSGTVDADVFDQWDAFGIRSTAPPDHQRRRGRRRVPPVGSIFNFVGSRAGIGSVHSTVPSPSGNLTSFTLPGRRWGHPDAVDVRPRGTSHPGVVLQPVPIGGDARSLSVKTAARRSWKARVPSAKSLVRNSVS